MSLVQWELIFPVHLVVSFGPYESLMTLRTTMRLFNNGKITVPAPIRDELEICDGDLVEIEIQRVRQCDTGDENSTIDQASEEVDR